MKKVFHAILFISLTLVLQACFQTEMAIPAEFVETESPQPASPAWYALNHSQLSFAVEIIDEELQISPQKRSRTCEFKLPNGRLKGTNNGEWGGELMFIPLDTSRPAIKILDGNIVSIFKYLGDIFVLEGLAHMGRSRGVLRWLIIDGETFFSEKIMDFDDAPEVVSVEDDRLLIATHSGFCVIKDLKREWVFKDAFWGGLGVNSIAVQDDHHVFMGISGGIVKLDLTTKELTFYQSDQQ